MEDVVDRLVEEVKALAETPAAEGGFAEALPLKAVYFGDPGIIPASLYPCATVDPVMDSEEDETTGADRRELMVEIGLHIDARDYFERDADEASGDRALVQATFALGRWFRRRSKRSLDGLTGVINVRVGDAQYRASARGSVITKSSKTTLRIRKGYARVLD